MKSSTRGALLTLVLIVAHLSIVSAREIFLTTEFMSCLDWTDDVNPCDEIAPCCTAFTSLNITEDTTLVLTSIGSQTGTPTLEFQGPYTLTIKPNGTEATEVARLWSLSATGSNDGESVVVEGGIWSNGLQLFLDQIDSAKIGGATLRNSSFVRLSATSTIELVDTKVESYPPFATISISSGSVPSINLPSNQTSIIIKDSSFKCELYESMPTCGSLISLEERNASWLKDGPGGHLGFSVLDSQIYGFQRFTTNDDTSQTDISCSYSFNSSSFAARANHLNDTTFSGSTGIFALPVDDSADESHFSCYNCTLRSFFTNTSAIPPIVDSSVVAQQIPLFIRYLASINFTMASVTHLSLNREVELNDLTKVVVSESNFTDVYFPLYDPATFECTSSIFIRATESPSATYWSYRSSALLKASFLSSNQFRFSSCSFTDSATHSALSDTQQPSLLIAGSSMLAPLHLADCTSDRLGLSGEVLLSGHLTVNRRISSFELDFNIPVRRSFSPSTSIARFLAADRTTKITFGGSVSCESIVFDGLEVLKYAPKSPGNETGIAFSLPSDLIFTPPEVVVALRESYFPNIQVIWPDAFDSMTGTFPLFSYPSSNTIETLPQSYNDSEMIYSFAFSQGNTSQGILPGVKFLREFACPAAPIPSTGFTCSNGKWTTNSSIITTIVINSPIQVLGNFSTTTLTINGLGSTIDVKGCVTSLPSFITVNLSPSDFESLASSKTLSKTLITSSCGVTNGQSISMTVGQISSQSSLKSCQRISGRLESRGTSMVGIFQLDSSRCSVWWIILVAVIGSVLLVIIILILVFSLVPSARRCIRPYLKRNEQRKSSKTTVA